VKLKSQERSDLRFASWTIQPKLWQGGGAGDVYENTLMTPTTQPTKLAKESVMGW